MRVQRLLFTGWALVVLGLLLACTGPEPPRGRGGRFGSAAGHPSEAPGMGRGRGMGGRRGGMGMHGGGMGGPGGSPWAQFHRMPVPEPYASMANPAPGDPESIERGRAIYETHCATCHGEQALGEAEAGQKLDPPAAPLARTTRRVSDMYLFWRIAEGGAAFGTAMPAYKDVLDEQAIWDVINYIRELSDQVYPSVPTP